MKKQVRVVLATTAVVGTALASAVAAPAQAQRAAGRAELSDFGFRSDVYGVKLVTENVEAFNVKDAHAQQLCTRAVGQTVQRSSVLSVPDNPLIKVGATTSRSDTYRTGDTHGVRGLNTIADIEIGGTVGDLRTPTLVIKGLRTTADAFATPKGFGHRESFDFASIELDLLDNTVVENLPPELQQLLEPLDQATGMVFQGTHQVANQVFGVLQDATAPIQIPGLGSVALGAKGGRTTGKSATSNASALRIEVTAGGKRQLVELGTARARVGAPAPAGVFRAGSTAMDFHALQDNLRFGSVQHKALPCEGTRGKTVTYRVAGASQLLGVLTDLKDITYQHSGDQFRKRDLAKGWTSTRIGTVSIPAAQLVIRDVFTKVRLRGEEGERVRSRVVTSVGSITAGGQPLAVPAPGQVVELPNGQGVIQRQLTDPSFRGEQAVALRIKLFEEAVVLDLARAGGHIYPR